MPDQPANLTTGPRFQVPLHGWRQWGLFVSLWIVLAILGAAEAYLGFMVSQKEVPLWGLVRRQFESWGAWGLVSVGILTYARWLQGSPRSLRRWLAWQFLGAAVACVSYSMLYALLVHGQPSILEPVTLSFKTAFPITLAHSSVFGLMVYWALVGGYHGLQLYARLREREREAADLERLLAQARLDVLRAQLHPHFLFNTLHTVSSLIHSRPETADRVVVRLSELLRASLDQGAEHEIPLRRELDLLGRYLEIEQARFGDRLSVVQHVDPGVLDVSVPALVLQPLAENAVRHGIEPRSSPGRIEIRARACGDQLELVLQDNGGGLQPESGARRREGIGLSNTRARLQQLYGDRQQFELNVPPEGGLEVRMRLPLHHAPDPASIA